MRLNMSKIRFKAIIIKYKKAHINGFIENKSTVGICLYDENTKRETKAQPISVVAKTWPSVKLQPLNTYMTRFVRFLNYCFFECKDPVESIADIEPNTVLSYFTNISMTSGRTYVRAAEDNVNKALYFLWKHEIATGFKESDFAEIKTPRGITAYLLYAVAYTLKMSYKTDYKIEGFFEYVVPPLEGFWWQDDVESVDYTNKSAFSWISVIRLPDFISKADFDWAVETATKKKKLDCSSAEYLTIDEGLCVQIMHIGSFDNEPATVALMDTYLEQNGYVNDINKDRLHHEIYMSDARKVAPEKWKTVIRHPIKKA